MVYHVQQFFLWGLLAFTLTIVGCDMQGASKSEVRDPWKVKTIHRDDYDNFVGRSKDVVELNNGEKIPDLGYEVQFVGEIPRKPKAPVLLFSAVDCLECEPQHFIIAYSPESGERAEFYHPGEVLGIDPASNLKTVLLRTRLFYGECLENWSGIIWFDEDRDATFVEGEWVVPQTWKQSAKKLGVGSTHQLAITDLGIQLPSLEEISRHVREGVCQEVQGPGEYAYL